MRSNSAEFNLYHSTPWGRRVAQVLCVILALIGAFPLFAGMLLKNDRVQRWTNAATERIIRSEFGLNASYRATLSLWPLEFRVEDLSVAATDAGPPALRVASLRLRPRVFSLFAGQINLGEVQVVKPAMRVVIRNGKLANATFHIRERKTPPKRKPSSYPPFTSLAIGGANIDIDLEGTRIRVEDLSADAYAKWGPSFELSLKNSRTLIDMRHHVAATNRMPEVNASDEDIICGIELQAHIDPTSARVRRFAVHGFADLDPRSGTRATCDRPVEETDPSQISLRLTEFMADWSPGKPRIAGKIALRLPVTPVNRFVDMLPVQGWLSVNTSFKWDKSLRLPDLDGHVSGAGLQLERYRIADLLDADFTTVRDIINIKIANVLFAEGRTITHDARIAPFEDGAPFSSRLVETYGMTFPGLMRALGVTPKTIVAWNFGDGQITDVKGQLAFPHIEGQLRIDTHGFEVFDRAFNDPARKHMIGVPKATVRARMVVQPNAFEFRDAVATFGRSQVLTPLVSIGFDNDLDIVVSNNTALDLADISPIVNIPMAGRSRLGVHLAGPSGDPLLTGTLAVDEFEFGGFPLGSIKSAQVRFRPLVVDFSDIKSTKGKSDYLVTSARLDFNQSGVLIADAQANSSKLDVRDFLAMWHFDRDPRYDTLFGWGKANARVHYVLGGAQDRCGDGFLRITSQVSMSHVEMYEEQYDAADADIDFTWQDIRAGYMGVDLNVPSLTLRKGMGAIVGSLQVRPGARLTAHAAATAIPLGRFNALGAASRLVDGTLAGVADASGTLDALTVEARANASRLFLGRTRLGPSEFTVELESPPRAANTMQVTRCGNPIAPPFDAAEYHADKPTGTIHVNGQLFGNQIELADVRISRQSKKHAQGTINIKKLDLAMLNEFVQPGQTRDIAGHASGEIKLDDLPLAEPTKVRGTLNRFEADVERGNLKVTVKPMAEPVTYGAGKIDIARLDLQTSYGQIATSFNASAHISQLDHNPNILVELHLNPTDLSRFSSLIPRAETLTGKLQGSLKLAGPWGHLHTTGALQIAGGELQLRGLDWPISNLNLSLGVSDGELKITSGEANLGMGKLQFSGGGPLTNMQLGAMRLNINASDVPLPSGMGLKGTVDARLEATLDPNAEIVRPHVSGVINMSGLEYNRPVQMTADVSTLAQRGRRSQVESYDPDNDKVDFDVVLHARSPLRINNELIEAELVLDKAGLELVGTNQRFGLRGLLQAKPAGRIHLRQHTFEIREGSVLFDDSTRINPRVDLRATTEYRRYSSQTSAATTGASGSSAGTDSTTNALGGRWRITMHAHGDADELHIDLTSDPALSPDDVFMLLTVGVTRTELNQAQSASMVSSVALEALGTLSGADRTVRNTIPVIDDFRFGSAYSSRTGRTEPTVTIGKRLSERIRATVTSGLAESREVRSNLEWQLSRRVSVEGSYDNVNDISSSQLGNLGADIRWRVEFR
jgi:translocation and assembly module TamB